MKRFTLLAALGLCSISLFAQDAQKEEPKEEGFVFTTVKEDVYKRQTLPRLLYFQRLTLYAAKLPA